MNSNVLLYRVQLLSRHALLTSSERNSMKSQKLQPWQLNFERILARSHSPLIAHDTVEPASEIRAIVAFEPSVCSDCSLAISDVLTQTFATERWLRLEGSDAAIAVYRQHHLITAQDLQASAAQGCGMCGLTHKIISRNRGDSSKCDESYSSFVKTQPTDRCRLRLCTGDVSRFTRSMREWEKSQDTVLQFFSSTIGGRQALDQFGPRNSVQCLQKALLHLQKLPDLDSSSNRNIATIGTWRGTCDTSHTICQQYRESWRTQPIPKRLVDIAAMDSHGKVHLCFPKPEDKWRYATVSYSWGGRDKNAPRVQTKNHNPDRPDFTEASRAQGIPIDSFAPTLRDAMRVAQELSFRYVWIDSLCIVQDDKEDKEEQMAALAQIYARGDLNLSATSGFDSNYGMLRHVAQHGVCIGRTRPCAAESEAMGSDERPDPSWEDLIYIGTEIPVVDLEDMPSATRAWIFQERLVSNATVHFTDTGLIWECAEHLGLNRDQLISNSSLKPQWAILMGTAAPMSLTNSSDEMQEMVFGFWNEWIAAYAARNISHVEERLVACSSMTQMIERRFDLHAVAGVWWEDIIKSLLWQRDHRCDALRKIEYISFPSWSWTSVQGVLNFVRKPLSAECENGPDLKLVGVESPDALVSLDPMPRVWLNLYGRIQKVVIDQWFHPGTGQRECQEVGVVSGFLSTSNVMALLDVPTGSEERYRSCWFLRVGSHPDKGRRADLFLILQQVDEQRNMFTRIGFARTVPWFNSACETLDSGKFFLPKDDYVLLI